MNRIVLITGASRGIGRALAEKFERAGDTVIYNYLRTFPDGKKHVYKADVSDPAAVNAMAKAVIEAHGRIDVIINNAGMIKHGTAPKMDGAEWDDVIKQDMSSAFYVTRAFAKQLMKQKGGAVINISSLAGQKGAFGSGAYSAAKAGLTSFTKTSAIELGRSGVRVNAVYPGFHMTDMGKASSEQYRESTVKDSVLNKTTDLGELVEFIYLLSNSKTVSGQVFNWDSRIL
jgi:3-oxoacyl-[acyl-carrier protein] reductase